MDEKRPAQALCLHPERTDQAFQLGHLGAQFAAGPFGLAGAFRGALAGLVDLDDVLVDIVGHGGLLLGGGGDLLVLV